jgi:lipopolysaccharide export system permease protein
MRTLDRYIGTTLAQGFALVLFVLLTIFSVLALVDQLDDVDKGSYQAIDAVMYVLLTAPGRMLDLAPVTALVGGIVGLGRLAKDRELIAMQASGVSVMQFGGSVMKTGLILTLAIAMLSEFFVPTMTQFAEKRRLMAVAKTGDLLADQGFWAKDGSRYLNVRSLLHGRIPADIDIYEFGSEGQLNSYIHADYARVQENEQWKLIGVIYKELNKNHITSRQLPELNWTPFLSVGQSKVLELPASTLSPSNLYQYIQYLRVAGQNADRFNQVFWEKVILPFDTGAMMLLSLPFVLGGTLRSTGYGLRLVLGVATGISFFVLDQIVANLGLLLGLSAPVIASIPFVAAISLAGFLLYRLH